MYRTSASFDNVVILESLPSGDLQSGTELFDSRLRPANADDSGFLAELYNPSNRSEFFGVLQRIRRITTQHQRAPIIQLETHGSREGLRLADMSSVTWEELARPFREINQACRMNLCVFAGLCHGWHMIDFLRPTDRSPVFALVGPSKAVSAGRLLDAMKLLYGELLTPPHDLRTALDVANGSSVVGDWEFRWMSAELMLCHIFRSYVEDVSRDGVQEGRVSRLVADLARAQGLDALQTTELRAAISSELDDHEAWFNRYRERFLLLDLFPENESRFKLAFEDCTGQQQ